MNIADSHKSAIFFYIQIIIKATTKFNKMRILICLAVYSIVVACSTKQKKEYPSNLIITDQKIEISIDDSTRNTSNCLFPYIDDNKRYLAYLNQTKNEIHFYDIDRGIILKKIKLNRDGPDGVGLIYGFEVVSLDSIYIASSNRILYLIDGKAKILNQIKYMTPENPRIGMIQLFSVLNTRLVFNENRIIAYTGLVGDWMKMDQNFLNNQYIEIEINSTLDSLKQIKMTYPSDYLQKGPKPMDASRVFSGNHFVYSFAADPYIYITNDHKSITKKIAKSDYIGEVSPFPQDIDIAKYEQYVLETGLYGSIVYDNFRDIYYRFCDIGVSAESVENINKSVRNRTKQSIIILDRKFNKIGETLLPEKRFKLNNFFVLKEGLYVSNNTPYNMEMDENKLSFSLFKFSTTQ